MRATLRHSIRSIALFAALLSVACVKDNIVYRDVNTFTQPPAGAANFVGYSKPEIKQTVCGNCHVDKQTTWAQTAHSDAWQTLQESGQARAVCEACHTVNPLGNASSDATGGWTATKDVRYQDVQCESCHGPGLTHITKPSLANRPLASIAVDTGKALGTGCGECHNGTHHPFVEEWKASAHSTIQSPTVGRAECAPCHNAQGALAAFGVKTAYIEQGGAELPITCAVCHDPHAKDNDKQLRFSISDPSEEGNLCMRCHHRRAVPDLTKVSSGAHSPEGPTLLGYAGWFPPSMVLDTIVATHGTDRNPRLCAGCHVIRKTVTDAASGNFVFQVTGHKFGAIPCVDSTGVTTTSTCDDSQRSFDACAASGCHGSPDAARSAKATADARVTLLVSTLNAMLAQVKSTLPGEFSDTDGKLTTAEGAKFNVSLATKTGAAIHNPFLIESLLTASIEQMQKDYALAIPPSLDLSNTLSKP